MKEKLTLTIDRAAIAEAKAFAVNANGTSLSHMVEKQFHNLSEPSFARSWRRTLKKFDRKVAAGDDRLRYLTEKYLQRLRLLLDTDVLLDVALGRPAFGGSSTALFDWCQTCRCSGWVAWHTISNLYYLQPAALGDENARNFIAGLLHFVAVASDGRRGGATGRRIAHA